MSTTTDHGTELSSTSKPRHVAHDLFFSAPLSGWGRARFAEQNGVVIRAIEAVKRSYNLASVYFAGSQFQKWQDFAPAQHAADDDLKAIRASRRFLLFYPERIVSSTLTEIGYALALNVPCVALRHAAAELPYILKGLVDAGKLAEVTFTDESDLQAKIAARHIPL